MHVALDKPSAMPTLDKPSAMPARVTSWAGQRAVSDLLNGHRQRCGKIEQCVAIDIDWQSIDHFCRTYRRIRQANGDGAGLLVPKAI